jgi:hypothetical protein
MNDFLRQLRKETHVLSKSKDGKSVKVGVDRKYADAVQTARRTILALYQIPPEVLGAKPRGRAPKITKAMMEKFMVGFFEKATGQKMRPYQKKVFIALLEGKRPRFSRRPRP